MFGLIPFSKSLAITLIIVFLLQIRVGNSTLEEKAMFWIHDSYIMAPVQKAAEGAVLMIRDSWNALTKNINTKYADSVKRENQPGFRDVKIHFDRSKAYLEEQARKAAEQLQENSEGSEEL